jgi:hypothetical protein
MVMFSFLVLYDGESVNRSQMNIKCKTCCSNLEGTSVSRHILYQHWYTSHCFTMHRNPQYRSRSATSAPLFQPLCHQRNVCSQGVTTLCDEHFPTTTPNIYLWISFALSPFVHEKCTTEHCSAVVHPQEWSPFWLPKPASEHACLLHNSWSWTVLLSSDTCKTYYIHYSCFTSICDLFTDSLYIYIEICICLKIFCIQELIQEHNLVILLYSK